MYYNENPSCGYVYIDRFYLCTTEGMQVLHDGQSVIDSTQVARACGVLPGCSLREAKAVLGGGVYTLLEPSAYRSRQQRWLDVCARYTDTIEPESMHTAWIDLSAHPRAAELVPNLARDLYKITGHQARVGIAHPKWVAKHSAHRCEPYCPIRGLVGFRPVIDTSQHIAEMPIVMLDAIPMEARLRLRALGYRTIGQARQATMRAMRGQFGDMGYRIYHAVRGERLDSVRAVYPECTIAKRKMFEEAILDRASVVDALRSIASELSAELDTRDFVGRQVNLYITTEGGVKHAMRKSSKPFRSARNIATLLELLFAQIYPESQSSRSQQNTGVIALRAVMPYLSVAKRTQAEFVWTAVDHERQTHAEDAFRVIRAAHGDHAVALASTILEPRRKQLLRAWRHQYEF